MMTCPAPFFWFDAAGWIGRFDFGLMVYSELGLESSSTRREWWGRTTEERGRRVG